MTGVSQLPVKGERRESSEASSADRMSNGGPREESLPLPLATLDDDLSSELDSPQTLLSHTELGEKASSLHSPFSQVSGERANAATRPSGQHDGHLLADKPEANSSFSLPSPSALPTPSARDPERGIGPVAAPGIGALLLPSRGGFGCEWNRCTGWRGAVYHRQELKCSLDPLAPRATGRLLSPAPLLGPLPSFILFDHLLHRTARLLLLVFRSRPIHAPQLLPPEPGAGARSRYALHFSPPIAPAHPPHSPRRKERLLILPKWAWYHSH